MRAKLTLGPLLFHWAPEKRRDFYFRIADEAPVDCVYLGESVCSKRTPFFAPYMKDVLARLEKAGKQVVLSSLAMITLPREIEELKHMADGSHLIEANDVAAIQVLKNESGHKGKVPFVVGPTINVLNEGALTSMVEAGARRIVFASELKGESLLRLAAEQTDIEKEVQVFGRQPLAISMRCYHARAYGRDKDHCRTVCGNDSDGLVIKTLSDQKILTVNGLQTLSYGYLMLVEEALALHDAGMTHFRLSPHDMDMVQVAHLFRDFMDGKIESAVLRRSIHEMKSEAEFINGFYHGREGLACVS